MLNINKTLLAIILGVSVLSGCGNKDSILSAQEQVDFTILATSDLKDVLPTEADGKTLKTETLKSLLKQETGLNVDFKFTRTMDGVESVQDGSATQDGAWFSNAKLLLSTPEGQKRVLLQEKIMYSPLVLGVSKSVYDKFGWKNKSVTWKDIAEKAKSGELKYAMSNPTTSNQGFSALVGVASAFSGKSEALTQADINNKYLTDFFKGYTLIGDNSAWLMDRFVEEQGKTVNAYINYESILTTFNNRLTDKLVLVYPKEGISTADYPFMLLKDNKRAEYIKIAQALKGEKIQKWLATQTGRRVVNEKVAEETAHLFPKETLIELSFPTDRVVIDTLLDSFMNKQKKPSAAVFIVDISGSMSNEGREQQLKQAFDMLTGNESSLTGRFSKFREREKVWVVPFSSDVKSVQYFEFGNSKESVNAMTAQLQKNINALNMDGGTALYSATKVGLDIAMREQKAHPEYNYTIVLFTDGEVNQGLNVDEFVEQYLLAQSNIHIFPILFGQGNAKELEKVALATRGKTFDGTKQKLTAVFKEIRGYQ